MKNNSVYYHWTPITKFCYLRGMKCEGCPNDNEYICKKEPWNKNPYGIRNIKYAVIRTLRNIGEPPNARHKGC